MVKNWPLSKRIFALSLLTLGFKVYSTTDSLIPELPEEKLREIAAKVLDYPKQADLPKVANKMPILTPEAARDLSLVAPKKTGDNSLFSKVNRAKTFLGEEAIKNLLLNPTNNIKVLSERQALLKKFKANMELFNSIEHDIDVIAKNQNKVLSLWSDSYKLDSDFLGLSTQLAGVDRSQSLTEATRLSALSIMGIAGMASTIILLAKLSKVGGLLCGLYNDYTSGFWVPDENGQYRSSKRKAVIEIPFGSKDVIHLLLSAGVTGLIKYRFWPAFKNQEKVSKQMLEHLSGVVEILGACTDLNEKLKSLDESKALTYANQLKVYTESFEGLSAEVNSLIKSLGKNTFKGKSSFRYMGRVRVAYKKFNELKDSFKNLFRAIAEVDAYASFIRLMKEYEDQDVHYNFAQFLVNDRPVIRATGIWQPTVEQYQIVPHTLNLGDAVQKAGLELADDERCYPNGYFTGPNGTGKSTTLLEFGLNILLAQTSTVVAANTFKLTPFDSIVVHANVEHNAKEGQSTFAVEQEIMNKTAEAIKRGCNNKRKLFAIIDEPYKSTEAEKASNELNGFINDIQYYDTAISLIASHFYKPAQKIEQENKGRFINLHIPVYEQPKYSGKFVREFKIKEGIDHIWFDAEKEDPERGTRYANWLAYTKLIK